MLNKDHKKVLVIYHYFAHYRLPVINEMTKNDSAEFTFLCGRTSDINIEKISDTDLKNNNVNLKYIENKWLGNNWLWQKGLFNHLKNNKYDAVIFLGSPYFISTWLASIYLKVKGTKVLFWTHGVVRNGGLKDTFRKLFFKLADGLLLYSNYAKENLIQHGFAPEKLQVINNSLDYDKHLEIRHSLHADDLALKKKDIFKFPELPTLFFIGRLTAQKKLINLIYLIENMKNKDSQFNLLFIGDGEERSLLEKEVTEKGLLDFVYFYGACHNETELAPLIAMCDVCVSPGEVGLTAIHSLSFGTPVITHNEPMYQMPEFESIKEGYTGALCNKDDLNSLELCVTNWINEHSDRDLIRKNCYEVIDNFYTPKFQVEAILKLI